MLKNTLLKVGEHLPPSVRTAGAKGLITFSRITGNNEIKYHYQNHEFKYKYTDRTTLRRANKALDNGEIALEGVKIRDLDHLGEDGHDGIIDIGAHFGVYSVVLAVLNPSLPVWCFEPNEYNLKALENNLVANNLSNDRVHARPELVSGTSGTVEFYEDPRPEGTVNHTLKPAEKHEGHNKIKKQSIALSDLLEDEDIHNPWVKIDAEGAEDEILEDLLTAPHIDQSAGFVELHLNREHITVDGISELLEEHGYEIEQVKESPGTPGYLFYPS